MPIPTPLTDEAENDFIARAHRELMEEIADTDQRNTAVFQAWRSAKGPGKLEKKAYEKFDAEKFVQVRDVPVFREHEYIDREGNLQKYDFAAMKAVCDRCNYRIENTGNFAALSNGHTPTKEQLQNGAKQPDVLGFSGPFRLGMVGNKEPRWAIFADERYFRDDAEKMRRLPNRSPEVWLAKEMQHRFMDPIAALGAETPRLDMGMRFARLESGEEVEKYSAVAPGASSVFVPGEASGEKPKERYADGENDSDTTNQKGELMLSPEDINQIVDAVSATDWAQWCKAKMDAEAGAEATPGAGDGSGAPPAAPPAEATPPAASPTSAPPEPKKPDGTADYSKVDEKARYAKLEQENAELKGRVTVIEADRRKTERYSKLSELRHTHELDLEKEAKRCESMTDAQFVGHLECIVENYARIPIGATIHVPATGPEAVESEKYSLACRDAAINIVNAERAKGNHGFSYEQGLTLAKEKLGKKSA